LVALTVQNNIYYYVYKEITAGSELLSNFLPEFNQYCTLQLEFFQFGTAQTTADIWA